MNVGNNIRVLPSRARAGTHAGTPSQAPTQAVSTWEKGQTASAKKCTKMSPFIC